MVIGWLKDYVQEGKVTITAVPTTVNEGPIGTYRTQALVLKISQSRSQTVSSGNSVD